MRGRTGSTERRFVKSANTTLELGRSRFGKLAYADMCGNVSVSLFVGRREFLFIPPDHEQQFGLSIRSSRAPRFSVTAAAYIAGICQGLRREKSSMRKRGLLAVFNIGDESTRVRALRVHTHTRERSPAAGKLHLHARRQTPS